MYTVQRVCLYISLVVYHPNYMVLRFNKDIRSHDFLHVNYTESIFKDLPSRVGVNYSTCTWHL